MTIVLSGVLMILVGRGGFQQEAGAFSVLGIDSLADQEDGEPYDPDFSAAVWSDVVSLVKISKEMYDEAKEFDEQGRTPMLEPAINARIQRAAKARQNTRLMGAEVWRPQGGAAGVQNRHRENYRGKEFESPTRGGLSPENGGGRSYGADGILGGRKGESKTSDMSMSLSDHQRRKDPFADSRSALDVHDRAKEKSTRRMNSDTSYGDRDGRGGNGSDDRGRDDDRNSSHGSMFGYLRDRDREEKSKEKDDRRSSKNRGFEFFGFGSAGKKDKHDNDGEDSTVNTGKSS